MKHVHTFKITLLSTVFSLLSLHVFAGPGILVNSPLVVGTTAASNIMFLIDNSGSMEHVVEESTPSDPDKFNASKTYITDCATTVASTMVPAGQNVFIYFTGGRPYMRYSSNGGTVHTIDYNASNKSTGDRCFNPTTNYSANIHASIGGTRPYWFTALYTGNYLNWYFKYNNTNNGGSVGKNWTSTAALADRYKPGTQIRRIIARDSMTKLVTALEATDVDVRLGLASFYSGKGAKIFDEIKYLDIAQRDSINTHIKNLGDGGGTPLAESLRDLGRYFIGETGTAGPLNGNLAPSAGINATNGSWQGKLTLHPDTTPSKVDANKVFKLPSSPSKKSPIQYWCQSNFVVATTDGLPTNDQDIPSYLKDYDSDCTTANACTPSSFDRKNLPQYIYESASSGSSDYLDDVAQAMFEIDLRPDINDYGTPTNPSGNPVKNNVITYTIAFADQDALKNQLLRDAGVQGGGEAIQATDGADLIRKFTEVTNKILATTSSAASVTFNTGSLQSSTALYQTLFTTSRWSGDILSYPLDILTGNFKFTCTPDVTLGCWKASTHLDKLAYNGSTFVNNRQIITYDAANKKGIPFVKPADFTAPATNEITTTMINDLCAGPDAPQVAGVACTSATASAKTNSQQYIGRIVDYIRGDRTFEAISTTPTFRTRQTVLGDIIHSAPVVVSKPSLPWPTIEATTNKFGVTGNRYSDYKTLKKNRTKALYTAANDGMLHAFRTETASASIGDQAGDELFAFMPSFIFSSQAKEGYHFLSNPNYTHKYYLDLSPTYTDIYSQVKDTSQTNFKTTTSDWHTVLISGSRGGIKKGIFALDISDPATITEANATNKILWEFTNNDDADLGYTFSKPTIVLTNAVGLNGLNRWAAVFGNGYQNDDGTGTFPTSVTCHAVLYVLFMDGGLDGTWTLGTNPNTADYMKIDTKVGTATAGGCNGLSTPALYDTNGDKILDRAYAGDVQGNMWAFDFTCGTTSCSTSDFKVAYTQGATPKPLFAAKDAAGKVQPIMAKPLVARNLSVSTSTSNKPNVIVLFGTGQYLTVSDNMGTTKINSFYGIWDDGTSQLTDNRANNTSTGSTLVGQFLTNNTTAFGLQRTITTNTVDWTKKHGWYIDLDPQDLVNFDAEERVVVNSVIRSKTLFFNTMIPNSQICGYGGSGWLMSLNFNTGGAPSKSIVDLNKDGVINSGDNVNGNPGVGTKIDGIPSSPNFIGNRRYVQTSINPNGGLSLPPSKCKPGIKCDDVKLNEPKLGRVSWHELRNNN